MYEGSTLLQTGTFHTSCSQNLFIGDKYGNFEVISFTNSSQGTVSANNSIDLWYTITNTGVPPISRIIAGDDNATPGDPGDDVFVAKGTLNPSDPLNTSQKRVYTRTAELDGNSTFTAFASAEDANNSAETCDASPDSVDILVLDPPTPVASCDDGKPKALVFEYVGEDCTNSSNSQGTKATCQDLQALGSDPVEVVYTGKNPNDFKVTPTGENVSIGDGVMIEVKPGKKNLENDVKFEIRRGGVVLQKLKIKADCKDVPLNVGDQFGSLILREYYPK